MKTSPRGSFRGEAPCAYREDAGPEGRARLARSGGLR